MTVANLSVIVAGYAIYLNVRDLHGIFTLYCQQTKEHFVFLSESMTNSRLFYFRYDKKNYVAGRHTIFYDYAEHQQYHIVGISRNSFDIMNVTEREFANVKKDGEKYRIVDYKEKKAYDFELVKGE